jgi:hypothetical protein
LDVDVETTVSCYIDLAQHTDLSIYDSFITDEDSTWSDKHSERTNALRYLLKLGWLTLDIKKHGLKNSIQILQSANGKFIAHPGTARAIVASYIHPIDIIKCFYIWDQNIDPDPFVLLYPHKIIRTPRAFFKMFNKRSTLFKISTTQLIEQSSKSDYFKLAFDALKTVKPTFSLDFLTVRDPSHWKDIRNNILFKDIISFSDNDTCILGGTKFTKINNKWTRM